MSRSLAPGRCRAIAAILVLCVTIFVGACSEQSPSDEEISERIAAVQERYRARGVPTPDPGELRRTFYPDRLNLPTFTTRIGDRWYLVDSYNNRLLAASKPDLPLNEWEVVDDDLSRPHSIAGNGTFLVVDDTEAHSVRVYRRDGSETILRQVIVDAGPRPHRTWFDEATDRFYILSAASQEILVLRREGEKLVEESRTRIASIRDLYTRSFRLIDGNLWLFTAAGVVSVVDHRLPDYPEIARYRVPEHLAGLNDMIRVGEHWYLSATRNLLAQCSLDREARLFRCEDLRPRVPFKGNPYLFHREGDALYLGVVAGRDTVLRIDLDEEGDVVAVSDLFPRTRK